MTIEVIKDPKLGKIHITLIPLKKPLPGWLQKSNNRVFHSVNGQVQFKQTRGYLSECGYPVLKDRAVVIVDASSLTQAAHSEVWKGDREHLRETITGGNYKAIIKETLKQSDLLKGLQQKIAREELSQVSKEAESDIFQKLIDNDKNLANLLSDIDPTININIMKTKDETPYEGKFSPTVLELEGKSKNENIEIPLNKSRPISAKTDAVNDYFHRADDTGDLYISDKSIEQYFRIRQSLKDGRLTVYFTPVKDTDLSVGMSFSFDLGLVDPTMAAPIVVPIKFIIASEVNEPKEEKKKKPGKPQKEDKKPQKGLPRYCLLTRDGRPVLEEASTEKWGDVDDNFNEYDGGIAEDLGDEGILYKINYDNAYHIKYLQAKKGEVERNALTKKYILGMRLLMLGFEHAMKSEADNASFEEYKDKVRRLMSKGAASTVLSLAEVLPKIIGLSDDVVE